MEILIILLIVFGIIGPIILLIKNENTFKNRTIISNAIHGYIDTKTGEDDFYEEILIYKRIEPYNATMFRLNDWGYDNILSAEDFEKVKPFI